VLIVTGAEEKAFSAVLNSWKPLIRCQGDSECVPLALQSLKENVFNTLDMPLDDALHGRFYIELFATENAKV